MKQIVEDDGVFYVESYQDFWLFGFWSRVTFGYYREIRNYDSMGNEYSDYVMDNFEVDFKTRDDAQHYINTGDIKKSISYNIYCYPTPSA